MQNEQCVNIGCEGPDTPVSLRFAPPPKKKCIFCGKEEDCSVSMWSDGDDHSMQYHFDCWIKKMVDDRFNERFSELEKSIDILFSQIE